MLKQPDRVEFDWNGAFTSRIGGYVMVLPLDLQDFLLRARVLQLYRNALRTARRAPIDARGTIGVFKPQYYYEHAFSPLVMEQSKSKSLFFRWGLQSVVLGTSKVTSLLHLT
ncbi:unnamed protein product [Cuscuta epithymum]|uniref:Uncharacterized protein n=1 Tax=Cuscuta epithymum TaxID=186058 RepID=A0AAV0DVV3_9ASTE|nr:unnamed protein product [Cuscuta epithymum]